MDQTSAPQSTPQAKAALQPKKDNALLNIGFNVILPVLILNKLNSQLGATNTLLLALVFPLGFGIWDYYNKRKLNFFSVLGLLNVLITGIFGIMQLTGIWFSAKEAIFPLLIGVFVFFSSYTKSPFIKTLFLNPQLIDLELLERKLSETQQHDNFLKHLKLSTMFLSLSFLVSAVLNFGLGLRIFVPIQTGLTPEQASEALNQQIAQMTSWSFAVIVAPSLVMLIAIFWHLLKGIQRITGLTQEELIKQ